MLFLLVVTNVVDAGGGGGGGGGLMMLLPLLTNVVVDVLAAAAAAAAAGVRPRRDAGAFETEELLDFSQDDLQMDDVYILDLHTQVFAWIGNP